MSAAEPAAGGPWWADLGERLDVLAPGNVPDLEPEPARNPGGHQPRDGATSTERRRPERVARPMLPALPDAAWIAGLSTLPGVGPARLGRLLEAFGASGAWACVLEGALVKRPEVAGSLGGHDWPTLVADWQSAARRIDVERYWARHLAAGVAVAAHGSPSFPRCLVDDHEPPAVLFSRGDPSVIGGARVAVVGTRRCSERGRRVAEQMGFDLSRAGVRVVSGLALGIDGAAHAGALRAAARGGAPPLGVVASGLDVIYPKRHAGLWRAVADAGVLLSELPLGVAPTRWRFPARNRIIAGLADLVVVVESPEKGGSMHTVDEAERRGVTVLAVPGAVGLRAGAGTNKLIFDGCGVARDADDVLTLLGLERGGGADPAEPLVESRPPPTGAARSVLDAVAWQPVTVAQLVDRVALPLEEMLAAIETLCASGWVAEDRGWIERVAS